ncbi:MAG: hypothetical protein ACI9YT_002412 [Halobacteriales archaeon]
MLTVGIPIDTVPVGAIQVDPVPVDVQRSLTDTDPVGVGGLPVNDGPESNRGRPCPLCEEPMVRRHCKYVCPRHGVVYDCSDTFYR